MTGSKSLSDGAATGSAGDAPRSDLRLSRWIGLILLLLVLVWHSILGDGLGPPWRRLWFDTLQTAAPRERPTDPPAYIIAIDESSIRAFGQWPWPRDHIAFLVQRLQEAGVRAIGVDILFAEPDRLSPQALSRWFEAADAVVAERLQAFGDTDIVLAEAMRRAEVVLPIAGIGADFPASRNNIGLNPAVVLEGFEQLPPLVEFADGLRATPRLQQAASSQAAIAFDGLPDGVVRRVPALQTIAGQPTLILGAETLRVAGQGFLSTVRPSAIGMEIDLESLQFPVERDGGFWLHFGRVEPNDPRYLPAAKVMNGEVGAETLAGKIALLAVTGFGTVDSQTTPLAQEVWGIEAHLQMIEQVTEGDYLRRPYELFVLETALLGLMGILLIQVVPRAPPVTAIGLGLGMSVLLVAVSYTAFRFGWLFDASAPLLGTAVTGAGLLGSSLIERDRERLIERAEREAEMRARELLLEAAAAMQRSVLPAPDFELPGKVRLAAHLTPSFDVGGDLYDHFLLDQGRLFFLVGDVSGKGIAACQFMGISKRLWKLVAQRMEQGIGEIQTTANTEIALDNSEMMFVTGIAGILDVETGRVSYSSAGHDQPILLRVGQAPHQLDEHTGPPAGLMADMPYPFGETELAQGDRLVLFSDGVTEALDAKRDAYGLERLIDLLTKLPPSAGPAEIIALIRADVAAFVGEAEQSDDLTLMVVERPVADLNATLPHPPR
ncbi:MAG: SpoIIE family protein phosphatase [Pseudomonadota bacterium]